MNRLLYSELTTEEMRFVFGGAAGGSDDKVASAAESGALAGMGAIGAIMAGALAAGEIGVIGGLAGIAAGAIIGGTITGITYAVWHAGSADRHGK